MGFISIKVAKFLYWLVAPNTTLLLYQGLGPAMLGHQRRPTIDGVYQVIQLIGLIGLLPPIRSTDLIWSTGFWAGRWAALCTWALLELLGFQFRPLGSVHVPMGDARYMCLLEPWPATLLSAFPSAAVAGSLPQTATGTHPYLWQAPKHEDSRFSIQG